MTITTSKPLRCLNCRTAATVEQEKCTRCGDRLKPRTPRPAAVRDEQEVAVEAVQDWYVKALRGDAPRVFRLFGYAGVGKTTLARRLSRELISCHDPIFAAYTGKAVSVLRSKGCEPARTLHSLLYHPAGKDANGKMIWDQQGGESALNMCDLLILDEVSMVDAYLARDIEAYAMPILVLGDPAQLPPVGGGGYYTGAEPDMLLTTVRRQASGGAVLEMATRVRSSTDATYGLTSADYVQASRDEALACDQILVARNSTRWDVVRAVREAQGLPAEGPGVGDRLMCLRNSRRLDVFNGQQFEVLDASGFRVYVRDDEGRRRWLNCSPLGFQGLQGEQALREDKYVKSHMHVAMTYAQAITVHKAQGSEWDSVYIMNDTAYLQSAHGMEQHRRWLYTAITRARSKVFVTMPY